MAKDRLDGTVLTTPAKMSMDVFSIAATLRKIAPWNAHAIPIGLSPENTPYTFRHTMTTELIMRGVSEIEIASLMRHAAAPNLRTTDRYVYVRPDFLANAERAVDEVANTITG